MLIKQGAKVFEVEVSENETILDAIKRTDARFVAPCNGQGKCGKCKVLVDGVLLSACQTKANNDLKIEIVDSSYSVLSKHLDINFPIDKDEGLGLVLDLGTTTLVYSFVDLKTGEDIKIMSSLNPQTKYGSDVISRVDYATKNGVQDLFHEINERTKETIDSFLSQSEYQRVKKFVVTGNTIMLHIFVNEDIESFGHYPFKAHFLESLRLKGEELGFERVDEIILLPCFSSFVGADLTAGYLASNLGSGNNVLLDIGTNGEIVSCFDGQITAISTAAGPAFEGANIECGIGGVEGAISHFYYDGNKISYDVINNVKPIGVCGSGLIDLISILKDQGLIDDSGLLNVYNKKYMIDDKLYLSQKDVRQIQLSKSAICSGIMTIFKINNIKFNEVDHVYISGGFGYYINLNNAMNINLLPKELKDKYVVLGNTSLLGGKMCLLNSSLLEQLCKRAIDSQSINLSSNQIFMDYFIENMSF